MAFVACTQNDVEELTDNRVALPETITGGFEGGDTRIELNEALKTVWTEGDEVSVFYKTLTNIRGAFQGKTGDRQGNILLSQTEFGDAVMDEYVVIYPYNEDYLLNTEALTLNAPIPATQSYKEGSYGENGNIMADASDATHVTLRSIYGWLRVHLTGDGEVVESITLRGNNGEQLAGYAQIDLNDYSARFISESSEPENDMEVGGDLVFEDELITEITLDCGEEVELGAEERVFYIALLPQTFAEGVTIEVNCAGYKPMTLSTDSGITIERNHIKPMAAVEYDAEVEPTAPAIELKSSEEATRNATAGQGVLRYELVNPVEGEQIVATSTVDWITVGEITEEGKIPYTYTENPELGERSGQIVVTYVDSSFTFTLTQRSATMSFNVFANSEELITYEAVTRSISFEVKAPDGINSVIAEVEYLSPEGVEGWISNIQCNVDEPTTPEEGAGDEPETAAEEPEDVLRGNVTFNVAEHSATKGNRSAKITLTYGDKVWSQVLTQEDAFPDDVVMNIVSVSASMRTGGNVWDLILNEQTEDLGKVHTQITVAMKSANIQYVASGTYTTPRPKGIYPGTVNTSTGEWTNSVYRYNTSRKEAITDCELTIAIDEATQTAAISGHFVSKQTNDETGRTVDVNVLFEWNGPVQGFRWEDPTAEITSWKTFAIDSAFDDCKCIKGVSNGGNEVAIYLHTPGATKADALAAGTYPVADWVVETTSNYCEGVSTKVNGYAIKSGSVTVEGGGDNYTIRYELSDGTYTYKGVYTGALY